MGGWSAEREVSLWSGQGVVEALRSRGVDVLAIDVQRENVLNLRETGIDRAFNVLHGTGGEDGIVQAALELQGIAYTGSGVLACALAMDKLRTKQIWQAAGLPTPDSMLIEGNEDALRAGERLGYPYFMKPSAEGSSVGVTKVKYATSAVSAFRKAAGEYQGVSGGRPRAVIAERFIAGGEYTCAILGAQALPVVRIEPDGEFYDYHAKYLSDATAYHCPAGLDPAQEAQIQSLCLRAFGALDARGWGRVDFMLDGSGQPWLIEANLVPGMTTHSLVPMAARAAGLDYPALCWTILEQTLSESAEASP